MNWISNRATTRLGAACFVALATAWATSAIADRTTHQDQPGDVKVKCSSGPCPPFEDEQELRDGVDIASARAGHKRGGYLEHTVIFVELRSGFSEGVEIAINTNSNKRAEYLVRPLLDSGGEDYAVYDNAGQFKGLSVANARFFQLRRKDVIRFKAGAIGKPDSYGWAATTSDSRALSKDVTAEATDRIPSGKGYLKHREG